MREHDIVDRFDRLEQERAGQTVEIGASNETHGLLQQAMRRQIALLSTPSFPR
jgi:hypothetical protein